MESKKFAKNDSGFVCKNCGRQVLPLGTSSRNHCPFCLCSIHIDNNPGDRANPCHGIMDPFFVEVSAKKGYVILHRCRKCGAVKRNRAANDARVQPDDLDLIIRLSAGDLPSKNSY
ncbi:MAG: RNHCP domain-containing protein [Clostridia bacterium]|nr:RNHCP domain-containing protein [Clostridia bacterium]